jgi:hypothetical protein
VNDYGNDRDAAEYLGIAVETLRKKMRNGIFLQGVHFTRPPGLRRRWIKRALAAFIEQGGVAEDGDRIMLRGASV